MKFLSVDFRVYQDGKLSFSEFLIKCYLAECKLSGFKDDQTRFPTHQAVDLNTGKGVYCH